MNREFMVRQPARYDVRGLETVDTPRLLFFQWALDANRERLRNLAGGYGHLRPMAKTVKASAVLEQYYAAGGRRVKASCVSEARVLAEHTSFADILIAFPLFGPAVEQFMALRHEFPAKRFSLVLPNRICAEQVSAKTDAQVPVFLDIDPGMRRTGVVFGEPLAELAEAVAALTRLRLVGLHIYDGHIHPENPLTAQAYSRRLMNRIDDAVKTLAGKGRVIEEVVTSSSLTAAVNMAAWRDGGYAWLHTISPGTAMLWDSGYNDILPDAFEYAAGVATRVVDVRRHEDTHIITTDCGIKLGVSPDAGPPQVLNFDGYELFGRSERFGTFAWLGFDRATRQPVTESLEKRVGSVVLVFPRHVCPTVNQYNYALLVRDGEIAERIDIDGRDG